MRAARCTGSAYRRRKRRLINRVLTTVVPSLVIWLKSCGPLPACSPISHRCAQSHRAWVASVQEEARLGWMSGDVPRFGFGCAWLPCSPTEGDGLPYAHSPPSGVVLHSSMELHRGGRLVGKGDCHAKALVCPTAPDAQEAQQIRKRAGSRHAPGDWIFRAGMIVRTGRGRPPLRSLRNWDAISRPCGNGSAGSTPKGSMSWVIVRVRAAGRA